jgi:hypothetical protein
MKGAFTRTSTFLEQIATRSLETAPVSTLCAKWIAVRRLEIALNIRKLAGRWSI